MGLRPPSGRARIIFVALSNPFYCTIIKSIQHTFSTFFYLILPCKFGFVRCSLRRLRRRLRRSLRSLWKLHPSNYVFAYAQKCSFIYYIHSAVHWLGSYVASNRDRLHFIS